MQCLTPVSWFILVHYSKMLVITRLFKSFEFRNGSRISNEKLVILEFKYLQNKKW